MAEYSSENEVKKGVSGLGKGVKASLSLAKGASGLTGASLGTALLLGPAIWIVLGILFLVAIFTVLSVSVSQPTLFETGEPDIGEVSLSLSDGYDAKKEESISFVAEKIMERYPEITIEDDSTRSFENGYIFSSEDDANAYEIRIYFTPELDEFSEMINAYANSVNGAIVLFGGVKTASDGNGYIPDTSVLDYNPETGEFIPSEKLEEDIATSNSEYESSRVPDFYDNLRIWSYQLFDYEIDADNWDWNLSFKTVTREKTHYYIIVEEEDPVTKRVLKTTKTEVEEGKRYDIAETEEYEIEQLCGTITVSMFCDVTRYKKEEIEELKSSLVSQEYVIEEGKEYKRIALDENQASEMVDEAIMNYFLSYTTSFADENMTEN